MDKFDTDTIDFKSRIRAPEVLRLRLALSAMGYRPVPVAGPYMKVNSPGKQPVMKNWREICDTADEAEIRRWLRDEPNCTNTGLLCGKLVGVDIDVLKSSLAEKIRGVAVSMLGETPLVQIGKAPKILLCFRTETPFRKMETDELFFRDGSKAQIEILADGQQLVAYGIHPDTGKPYSWPDGSPETVHFDELPVVNSDHLSSFVKEAGRIIREAGGRTKDEIDGKAAKPPPVGAKRIDFGKPGDKGDFFREVNRAALVRSRRGIRRLPNRQVPSWNGRMARVVVGPGAGVGGRSFHASRRRRHGLGHTEIMLADRCRDGARPCRRSRPGGALAV